MRPTKNLVLRRERLTELQPDELREVVGGDSLSACFTGVLKDFTDWQSICWCYTG